MALLLGSLIVVALLAQLSYEWLSPSWIGPAAAASLLAVYLGIFFQPLRKTLDTPYFAILSLLFIALGTALGTFVAQNAPAEIFTQRYGAKSAEILRLLQFDDVFHSWWYVGLYALLGASLIKLSLRRKFNRENLGFYLAHLGPVVILFGFWVDYFYGFRGIIKLETGESTTVAQIYRGNTNYLADSVTLPFRIRLDHFEFEKYQPDYRLQVWRHTSAPNAQLTSAGHTSPVHQPEIVASFPLDLQRSRRIYGTDRYFWLKEFYPNFQFDYTYPDNIDTIDAVDPGVLLTLETGFGKGDLQLLGNRPGRNIFADEQHLGAWLEFSWERPSELQAAIDGQPDAKWAEVDRVLLVGADRKVYYLTDGALSERPLQRGERYTFPKKEGVGFTLRHLFPNAAYLKSVPVSDGDELLNPVARVEVWKKGGLDAQEAFLYPGRSGKSGIHAIPGTEFFLALESFKDQETKYWKSELAVLNERDEVLKTQSIKVNEPMLYSGYRFYQSDYDPENPNYSGIGISHEPGLFVIYLGFVALVLGCGLLFYNRLRPAITL